MTEYTITDAYRLPTEYACPFPFDDMKIGESFAIPVKLGDGDGCKAAQIDVLRQARLYRNHCEKPDFKITTRTIKDESGKPLGVRVWRTA